MNPLDLTGPAFLMGWIIAFPLLLLASRLGAPWLASLFVDDEGQLQRGELDAYEVAFLQGGAREASLAACAALQHTGAIEGSSLRSLQEAGPLPSEAHPLERAVHENLGSISSPRSLLRRLRAPLDDLRASLVHQGLMVSDDRAALFRIALFLPALALLGLGVAKVAVGLDRGRPVSFLVVLLIASVVASGIVLGSARRRSVRGQQTLRRLRQQNAALRSAARNPSESLSGHELAMAVGIYGSAALAASVPLLVGANRWGATHAGGHGCGSSCGSSCGGGGCGGGCGGCGS